MIWLATDENGDVSKPLMISKNLNSELYLKECIIKRLTRFIKNKTVLFWPDMATSHYAKKVTYFLHAKKVVFVEKKDNAPNVPQARPIERFWAYLKREYSRLGDPPKTLRGFLHVIGNLIKKVARNHGKTLMKNVRSKIRKIGRDGVYGPLDD